MHVQNTKRPGNSTKQALIRQEANAIAAVNAIECIHRNQSNTVIPKQPVCWPFACMWNGSSFGSIGRVLKVNPQSVANWVSQYTAKLPNTPMPKVKKAELDELYIFIGKKKTRFTS